MEQKKEKGLRIRSCLTGAIWLALVFSTVISALLFAFLNHFFNLPGSIPVLGWLLIFNTLIAGLITSFINAKLLEPITRLSKAMKEVSQGDFEQHLETNSRIAECGSGDPHRTIYDAFGFVLCNYDCMSAFSKSVFTGIGNAVKYCGTGCVDSVRMP